MGRAFTAALVLTAAIVVRGQSTPQQYLADAKQALDAVVSPSANQNRSTETADLTRDFAALQAAYTASLSLAQPTPTAGATPAPGATAAPAATPNAAAPSPGQTSADWQRLYAAVQTDLILAEDTTGPNKGRFDQFRSRLEKFYNAALDEAIKVATAPPPQTITPTTSCPAVAPSVGREAVSLLDRIQTIVDATLAGKSPDDNAVATSGSKEIREAGKVSIDRASLDEIRAEIAHLKLTLQASNSPNSP